MSKTAWQLCRSTQQPPIRRSSPCCAEAFLPLRSIAGKTSPPTVGESTSHIRHTVPRVVNIQQCLRYDIETALCNESYCDSGLSPANRWNLISHRKSSRIGRWGSASSCTPSTLIFVEFPHRRAGTTMREKLVNTLQLLIGTSHP